MDEEKEWTMKKEGKKLRHLYRRFTGDKPGQRFQNLSQGVQGLNPWMRILVMGGGIILTITGLLIGWLPGVPGLVIAFLGAGLIATQFRFLAHGLDRLESKGREWWHQHHERHTPPTHLRAQVLRR